MTNLEEPQFTIENNILKGCKVDYDKSKYHIGKNLLNAMSKNAGMIGQIDAATGKTTTYGEMKDRSIRCALWLRKQGIGAEDVVAYCTPNHLDSYIPALATYYVGGVYNAWHHEVPLKTAKHLANLMKPKIMFVYDKAVDIILQAIKEENVTTKLVVFGNSPGLESLEDILQQQTDAEVASFTPTELNSPKQTALVLFSSGTTGLPKGVQHSFEGLHGNLTGSNIFKMDHGVSLCHSSLYWISGTFCLLEAVLSGSTRLIHTSLDPEEICKVIEKYKVSWFFVTPTSITQLCKAGLLTKYDMTSLRRAITGGAKLSKEIFEQFQSQLPHVFAIQVYGMTEVGGAGTMPRRNRKRLDSVGVVAPNIEMKIIDTTTREALGPNQQGEICFKSPTLMMGYYKNPKATEESIDKEGWLLTGDLGLYDENGEVFITDRIKEVMKFRGHHVSPLEIEEVLLGHPGVMIAAVVPVPHSMDLERPMAFVKKLPGAKVTEEELIKMSAILGEYKKLWGGVVFVEKIPYTASGKISRKDLRDMAKAYAK